MRQASHHLVLAQPSPQDVVEALSFAHHEDIDRFCIFLDGKSYPILDPVQTEVVRRYPLKAPVEGFPCPEGIIDYVVDMGVEEFSENRLVKLLEI